MNLIMVCGLFVWCSLCVSVYVDCVECFACRVIKHFFHSSTHCFPTSLNVMRSSKELGCATWEHCNMCAVVSSALPQAHVVSPV